MKKCVNGFIIVEGGADKAFLSSFLNCEVIVLGGFAVPHRTIEYIKALSKIRTPLLLTDPDEAGETIRKRVNSLVDNVTNLYLHFDRRNNYKKHGVAESSIESVLEVLTPYLVNEEPIKGDLKYSDLVEIMSIYGQESKNLIASIFKLGTTSSKVMIQRLNYLCVKKEDVIKVLENGN